MFGRKNSIKLLNTLIFEEVRMKTKDGKYKVVEWWMTVLSLFSLTPTIRPHSLENCMENEGM